MATNNEINAVAERQLTLRNDKGQIDVRVRIGKPELDASGENWKCPYEIWFGESCKTMAMHGVDSMQALQLTIATIDVELEVGAKKHSGVLHHYEEPFTSILENGNLQMR